MKPNYDIFDMNGICLFKGYTLKLVFDVEKGNEKGITFSELVLMLVNYKSNKMFSILDVNTSYNSPLDIYVDLFNGDKERLNHDYENMLFQLGKYGEVTANEIINATFNTATIQKQLLDGKLIVHNADEEGINELIQKLTIEDEEGYVEYVQHFIKEDI